MRWSLRLGLGAVLNLGMLAGTGLAQQGYFNRVTTHPQSSSAAPSASPDQAGSAPLSRTGSRSRGYSGNGQYQRATSEPPRTEPSHAVTTDRSHHYFPGLRTGQAPNRNYIPPHKLCAPGRRPFMYR
jgi:hypothetical protein